MDDTQNPKPFIHMPTIFKRKKQDKDKGFSGNETTIMVPNYDNKIMLLIDRKSD